MTTPRALVISPHLDDGAFSCGGAMAQLAEQGWQVEMITPFTASVPNPSGFALRCQTDKGIPPSVDYMALRRDEDIACGECLGVSIAWLDLPEAPHRGYDSAVALFGPLRDDDTIWQPLAETLALHLTPLPELIFAPQGLGGHVDHRQVILALLSLKLPPERLIWYRDTPYAIKEPTAQPDPHLGAGLRPYRLPLSAEQLQRKIAAARCYQSQLAFQFGGPQALADKLQTFARHEAAGEGLAEGIAVTTERALWRLR